MILHCVINHVLFVHHPLMDIWVVSILWQLGMVLLGAFPSVILCGELFSITSGGSPGWKLLGHRETPRLTCLGSAGLQKQEVNVALTMLSWSDPTDLMPKVPIICVPSKGLVHTWHGFH